MTSPAVVHSDGADLLRVAVAAYLARYKGLSRYHTESDLHVFLRWCTDRGLDPLTVRRVDVELFVRWLQEVRRVKPSTGSRRLSVVICFYRTCVIDAILDSSLAAYVRRPPVAAESPTLGLSHLQFEAMLVAARTSTGGVASRVRGIAGKLDRCALADRTSGNPPRVRRSLDSGPPLR